MLKKFLFNLTDEKGISMITVIGVMLLVTILAFGLSTLALNDLSLSLHSRDSTRALHVAEAGIQRFLWQLEKQGNNPEPTSFVLETSEGTATVVAESSSESGREWLWSVVSTGKSGNAVRKIKVTIYNFSLWNLNISGLSESLPAGGNGINGTTSVSGPFYVRGTVQLSGTSKILDGPLFIKEGSLVLQSHGVQVGGGPDGESTPAIELYIEPLGSNPQIADGKGNPIDPYNTTYDIYPALVSRRVPAIRLPELKTNAEYREIASFESTETLTVTYQEAMGGSKPDYYKVIDNDNADNQSYSLVINADTPSFGVTGNPPTFEGDFGWDASSRTLKVEGTVFVDGPVTIGDSNEEITYIGQGTIVANGPISIYGRLIPPIDESKGYPVMSREYVIGFVNDYDIDIYTSGSNSNPSKEDPDLAGAFYTKKEIEFHNNNVSFVGSMIAGILNFGTAKNNHLFTHEGLPSYLPPSLPGSTEYLTMTTAWREIK
jgi:hypothetical protein